MQRIAEEEFDEAELFDTERDGDDTIEQACEHSDDEEASSSSVSRNPQHQDTSAGDHGSAKSTTSFLNSTQEVAVTSAAVDTTSAYVGHDAFAALHSLHTAAENRRQPYLSQSLPAQHVKMGSSVPISIPFLQQRNTGKFAEPQQINIPATFVPPHELLSQRDDYTLAMMGESPSTAMKRDRLRVRNAVLKSTGFLEPVSGSGAIGISGSGLSERAPGSAIKGAGGLSQALQLVGSPAAAIF